MHYSENPRWPNDEGRSNWRYLLEGDVKGDVEDDAFDDALLKHWSDGRFSMMSLAPLDALAMLESRLPKFVTKEVRVRAHIAQVRFAEAHQGVIDEPNNEFIRGKKFETGDGVKKDYKQAAEHYLNAAKNGHAKAQNNLGLLYLEGLGVEKDKHQAALWMMKAAEQGLGAAQENIANSFLSGEGVPESAELAEIWFRKAADQGSSSAQFSLGEYYEYGWGGQINNGRAIYWYSKAAGQGDDDAQASLLRLQRESASSMESNFSIPASSSAGLVHAAIQLLKNHPTVFYEELAELRTWLLANNTEPTEKSVAVKAGPNLLAPEVLSPRLLVAQWLLDFDSITSAELRNQLLPFDLLPNSFIDELNEQALDLTGDIALEEVDGDIVVNREVLRQVLAERG